MNAPQTAVADCSQNLVEACRSGDPDSFRELFEAYKDRVYSFALRFFANEEKAADLTQDIFVKLYTRLEDFRGDSRFDTWLYRVVANACLDEQRKWRKLLPFRFGERGVDHHPTQVTPRNLQEREAARQQTAGAVHTAIAALSPALRAPVLLRYMEDLSYEEIGQVLNLAPGTVASRLSRAHGVLEKKLSGFRERLV